MDDPQLYALVGEDELGSGEVGIKAARVPAGFIPIVVVDRDLYKIQRPELVEQIQAQARQHGKQIRLVRYEPVEVVRVFEP